MHTCARALLAHSLHDASPAAVHVKPDQMIHFLDVLREQRGSGRPSTAFLIVEWPLAPEALAAVRARFESAQLQLEDLVNATMQPGTAPDRKSSGSGTALMSEIWKSNESAYKGVMSPSKFTVLLEEEAIPEDGVLNVSGLGGGMGAESRTPGDEGHRSMSEDGGGGDSGGSGRALPAAQPQGTGFSAAAGSSGASEGAAARTPVRASARGQASGVAESASTMSPGDAAGGVAQGSAGGSQFVGAGSAAASGGSFNKQQVEREVLELRRKVVELERLGLQVRERSRISTRGHTGPEVNALSARTGLAQTLLLPLHPSFAHSLSLTRANTVSPIADHVRATGYGQGHRDQGDGLDGCSVPPAGPARGGHSSTDCVRLRSHETVWHRCHGYRGRQAKERTRYRGGGG